MNRLLYLKFIVIRLVEKIIGKTIQWGNIKVSNEPENILKEKILSGKPFCLIRPGTAEMSFVCWWEEHTLIGTKRYTKHKTYSMMDNDSHNAERWVNQFEQDLREADIIATLGSKSNYVIEKECKHISIIPASVLNLNMEEDSWLWCLRGKRVLIVSPFADSMKSQMKRIDKVWAGDHVLKHVDVVFQNSVWYTGQNMDSSGFASWQDAYQYLKTETMKHSFDIALLSCGPFSSFLAADIKRAGRQAIQYGGVLQLMFGIRGKRWDDLQELQPLYNEYWIRPNQSEYPKSQKTIHGLDEGCYW